MHTEIIIFVRARQFIPNTQQKNVIQGRKLKCLIDRKLSSRMATNLRTKWRPMLAESTDILINAMFKGFNAKNVCTKQTTGNEKSWAARKKATSRGFLCDSSKWWKIRGSLKAHIIQQLIHVILFFFFFIFLVDKMNGKRDLPVLFPSMYFLVFQINIITGCLQYKFVKENDKMLRNHVIKSIPNISPPTCRSECVHTQFCFSINMKLKQGTLNVNCELNNSSKAADPQDLKSEVGSEYSEMAVSLVCWIYFSQGLRHPGRGGGGGGGGYKKGGDARRKFLKLTPKGDQSGRRSRMF